MTLNQELSFKSRFMRNRLRTSCASAVGRGDFKKMKTEDGAVQPITASTRLRFAPPKLLPSVATSGTRGTLCNISR